MGKTNSTQVFRDKFSISFVSILILTESLEVDDISTDAQDFHRTNSKMRQTWSKFKEKLESLSQIKNPGLQPRNIRPTAT